MDPVSTFALAASIVTCIDFSCKIVSEARELRGSSTGASVENDLLETISKDLLEINNDLTAPSTAQTIPEPIRSLASQSRDVTNDLLGALNTLKIKDPAKKWPTFKKALQSVWQKDRLERLVKQLDILRAEMSFRLQLTLR